MPPNFRHANRDVNEICDYAGLARLRGNSPLITAARQDGVKSRPHKPAAQAQPQKDAPRFVT